MEKIKRIFATVGLVVVMLSISVLFGGIFNACYADEAFMGFGLGVFRDADSFYGQNKYLDFGYRKNIFNGIYWQSKGGYWGEGGPDQSRQNSWFFSTGIGMELDLSPVEFRAGFAPAVISTTDSQLGSHLGQFNEDMALGLRDKYGNGAAIQYNHISCGSLCSPNMGRDFVILELSKKW